VAHVLLPISTFVETSGTYVNLEGLWQSFAGAAKPLGEARPGWKVLRVLGNLAGVATSTTSRPKKCARNCARVARHRRRSYQGSHEAKVAASDVRVVDVPMYSVDAVLRRAPSLQRTRKARARRGYGGRAHERL
jgi:NADH-quinone oxidoreductase subunit G